MLEKVKFYLNNITYTIWKLKVVYIIYIYYKLLDQRPILLISSKPVKYLNHL